MDSGDRLKSWTEMAAYPRHHFKYGRREKAADEQWFHGYSNRSNGTGSYFPTKYDGSKWSYHALPRTHKDNANAFPRSIDYVMCSENLAVKDMAGDCYSPLGLDSGCSTAEASGEDCPEGDSMRSNSPCDLFQDHAKPVLKELLFTIGKSVQVTVAHVEGPSTFWCQLNQSAPSLKKLMDDLQNHYTESQPLQPTGPDCVVRHPHSGLWHRGRIIKLQPFPYVDVLLVDYGYTFRVTQQDLRPLDAAFASLKCQAFQCRLIDLTCPSKLPEWNESAVTEFGSLISSVASSTLKCTIYGIMYDSEGTVVNLVDLISSSFTSVQSQSASASISQKDSKKCSAPEMEVGSQEKVLITCVKDVHTFYGQLMRHMGEIEKLNERIESFCCLLQTIKGSLPTGAPCFAKYSDGQWYRGRVIMTQPTILVHFLDYGDIVTVKKSNILPVPNEASEIMSVPPQVVELNLSDAPLDTSTEVNRWFEDYATGKFFTATVLEKHPDGKCTVELYNGKSNVNKAIKEKIQRPELGPLQVLDHSTQLKTHNPYMLREYQMSNQRTQFKENFGLKQQRNSSFQRGGRETTGNTNVLNDGNISAKLPMSQRLGKKPFYNPKKEVFSKVESFGFPVKKEGMVIGVTSSNTTIANAPQTQKPVSLKGIHGCSEVSPAPSAKLVNLPDRPIRPGVVVDVYVSHVNSPESFFVQLVEDEERIHSLVKELNKDQPRNDSVTVSTLKEGDVVSAVFPDDESWYRAVIKKVNDRSSVLVEFIDFGNEATVVSSMVQTLRNSFLDTPRLSVHCSLNVDMPGLLSNVPEEEVAVKLKGMAEGEPQKMACMFIKRSDIVWEISFVCPDTAPKSSLEKLGRTPPTSTPDSLSEAKQAASTTDVPCPSESYTEGLLNLKDIPSRPITPGVGKEVYISHVNSQDSFYIQLVEDEDQIYSLVEELNTDQPCSQSAVNVKALHEGDVVVAMYPDDESWYRAVVKKVNDNGSALVEFIDFGNEAIVMSTMVNSLEKRFQDIPRLSVHCCVGYNVNGPHNGTPKEEMTAKLKDYAKGEAKKLSCMFAKQSDLMWEVCFVDPDTTLKNSQSEMANATCEAKASSQDAVLACSLNNVPCLPQPVEDVLPKLAALPDKHIMPGVVTDVYVSHVNSPYSLFVQLVEDEDRIHSLLEELNKDQPCNDSMTLSTLEEGDVVSAVFPDDESWYRAVVKKVNDSSSVLVEFIDFGNEATVMSSQIRCLKKSFLEVPKLSVHCCLNGGSCLSAEELMTKLKETVDGEAKKMNCVFIKESGHVWEIHLADSGTTIEPRVPKEDDSVMVGL